jgi:hypothetical protein
LAGVGSLLIGSITTRDYAIIQLSTLFFAAIVVIVNLAADLLYVALDPVWRSIVTNSTLESLPRHRAFLRRHPVRRQIIRLS